MIQETNLRQKKQVGNLEIYFKKDIPEPKPPSKIFSYKTANYYLERVVFYPPYRIEAAIDASLYKQFATVEKLKKA